jgi:hypothetical protein
MDRVAVLAFGVAFALRAGLAVSAVEPPDGGGPRGHTATGRAVLGVGAALLVGHLLMPPFGLSLTTGAPSLPPLGGILFVVVAAFVELILFGLERWMSRPRASVAVPSG